MAHTLAQFNDAAPQDAAAMLADLYPHAPWAAQQAVRARPMHSVAQLQLALQRAVDDADVATPVSYTHLDVYKRQELMNWSITTWAPLTKSPNWPSQMVSVLGSALE